MYSGLICSTRSRFSTMLYVRWNAELMGSALPWGGMKYLIYYPNYFYQYYHTYIYKVINFPISAFTPYTRILSHLHEVLDDRRVELLVHHHDHDALVVLASTTRTAGHLAEGRG